MEHENKVRMAVWLRPSTLKRIDSNLEKDNAKTRSEFIENAAQFYSGYLESGSATGYMSEVLANLVNGIMEDNEMKLRTLLFRLCVEISMACHTVALCYPVDEETLRRLRQISVEEVKRTNGKISFEQAVDEQR